MRNDAGFVSPFGYNERRKLRTSCFWSSWSLLKFLITAFASDALKVKKLPRGRNFIAQKEETNDRKREKQRDNELFHSHSFFAKWTPGPRCARLDGRCSMRTRGRRPYALRMVMQIPDRSRPCG